MCGTYFTDIPRENSCVFLIWFNKTFTMSTMIHTINRALSRWQVLYTTSAVACEPLVGARRCSKHLIYILSFTAQNIPRKWVQVHLRKLRLRKRDELAQSNTTFRWQSWGSVWSQPNSQIFKYCIWHLWVIWHLYCPCTNVHGPQVCRPGLWDLCRAPGNRGEHMIHA